MIKLEKPLKIKFAKWVSPEMLSVAKESDIFIATHIKVGETQSQTGILLCNSDTQLDFGWFINDDKYTDIISDEQN